MFTLLLSMRREEESPQTGEGLSTKVESRSVQTRQYRAEDSVRRRGYTSTAHVLTHRAVDSAATIITNLRQQQTCTFCEEEFLFEGTVFFFVNTFVLIIPVSATWRSSVKMIQNSKTKESFQRKSQCWRAEISRKEQYKGNNWRLLFFLFALAKLRKATIRFVVSVCPSVRPSAWNNSAPTGRIFMKFDIWIFFENLSKKFNFH